MTRRAAKRWRVADEMSLEMVMGCGNCLRFFGERRLVTLSGLVEQYWVVRCRYAVAQFTVDESGRPHPRSRRCAMHWSIEG